MPVITRTDTLAGADAALVDGADLAGGVLEVLVVDVVPAWLPDVVDRAHAQGAQVAVCATPDGSLSPAERAGWEIGVCTAAQRAGVDRIDGIDPRRVARVGAVVHRLDAARATQEDGS